MAELLSVNVGVPRASSATRIGVTGIDKRAVDGPERAAPGAYLRVVEPGEIRAGDRVEVVERPGHDVTIGLAFRALTLEPGLLPRLLAADTLPEKTLAKARRRVAAAS